MNPDIQSYIRNQAQSDQPICDALAAEICKHLPQAENKIWHRHPAWFLDGNSTVGYSKQKPGIRLMFWSGADFEEEKLNVMGKKFKDASIFYNDVSEIDTANLKCWLEKAQSILWDYKNILKRRG